MYDCMAVGADDSEVFKRGDHWRSGLTEWAQVMYVSKA